MSDTTYFILELMQKWDDLFFTYMDIFSFINGHYGGGEFSFFADLPYQLGAFVVVIAIFGGYCLLSIKCIKISKAAKNNLKNEVDTNKIRIYKKQRWLFIIPIIIAPLIIIFYLPLLFLLIAYLTMLL